MPHLEAFALKETGSQKTLAAPAQTVRLASPTVGVGRHVGLTGPNPEQRTTWIHVAPEGEWEGHQAGAFKLDRATFAECVAALRACETPPPVDYDHASLRPLDGQPTPAAGYILDLAIRDDGLWALVELTERAADMVKSGEYRFCSGVFVWDGTDRKSGEAIPCQLDSIGLTNKPFIDGQHAIRLSRRALSAGAPSMEIKKTELMDKLDALVSGATVTADEIKALVEFLEKSKAPAEEPAAEEASEPEIEVAEAEMAKPAADAATCATPAPAEAPAAAALAAPPPPMPTAAPMAEAAPPADAPPAATESADSAAMILSKLAELTGLDTASLVASLEANGEQIKAAFLGGDGGQMPYSALSAKVAAQETVIAGLTAEITKYRTEEATRADAALVAEVETHVAAGRILPGQRESFVALARKAPAEFRALASSLPQRVPMGRDTPTNAPATGASSIGTASADSIGTDHPRYVALHARYADPTSPYARYLPKGEKERAESIDRMVRNHLRNEQPIGG